MKYTQINAKAFEEIQLNAGVLVSSFTPGSGELVNDNIIGATTGGVNFTDTPSFVDFGEDIDNCPKKTKELTRIDDRDVKLSGTFVTMNSALAVRVAGAADADGDKITPRDELKAADFKDLWWVGDYSNKNGENGGYIAIHMLNTLSTGGFQIQTGDKSKGNFSFEFTGHYSLDNIDTVPYEIYIHAGT